MEIAATFKHIRRGPRKLRAVVDMVRGKAVQEALDVLKFGKRAGCLDVSKIIRSALSQASVKPGVNVDTLYIKKIFVDQGTILKRFMPRAKGSADQIMKKMSHLTVVLDEKI